MFIKTICITGDQYFPKLEIALNIKSISRIINNNDATVNVICYDDACITIDETYENMLALVNAKSMPSIIIKSLYER
jgi:hypothetical protein